MLCATHGTKCHKLNDLHHQAIFERFVRHNSAVRHIHYEVQLAENLIKLLTGRLFENSRALFLYSPVP